MKQEKDIKITKGIVGWFSDGMQTFYIPLEYT